MNKAELIAQIADATGKSKADVEELLAVLAATVHRALNVRNAHIVDVALPGLGKISVAERAARQARNPRTGEMVKVPAKRVPHFSAAKALKDAVAS